MFQIISSLMFHSYHIQPLCYKWYPEFFNDYISNHRYLWIVGLTKHLWCMLHGAFVSSERLSKTMSIKILRRCCIKFKLHKFLWRLFRKAYGRYVLIMSHWNALIGIIGGHMSPLEFVQVAAIKTYQRENRVQWLYGLNCWVGSLAT